MRYALRSLFRTPGFTIAAVLSIAIGIGANTAIYSVASALLLHPLPYKDADRLVILWNRSPGLGIAEDWFSTAQYFDIKNGHSGFDEQIAIARAICAAAKLQPAGSATASPSGSARSAMSSNLLPMLGARPSLGPAVRSSARTTPARRTSRSSNHGTWLRRYGGDPRVVGTHAAAERSSLSDRRRPPSVVLAAARSACRRSAARRMPKSSPAAARAARMRRARDREDYNIIGTAEVRA